MILQELMRENSHLFSLSPNSRIFEAAEVMRREHIGSVVIVENEKVVGIITDRDIALSLALGAGSPDSFLSEIMTRDVETVSDTMSLLDVTRFFRKLSVKRLPVIDSNDRLVGIISSDDVIAILSRQLLDTCSSLESKLGHSI